MTVDRELAVSAAFVRLATSLADGDDMVALLSALTTECAELLDIASAGLLLADRSGILHVMAASSERTRNLELFQLQRDQGPCLDCFHTGAAVSVPDLKGEVDRWPTFVAAALELGFASLHALPMRLRAHVFGALGLFGTTVGSLTEEDLRLAQALAHVASVALVVERAATDTTAINEQLQQALTTRVQIEQAKGLLAHHGELDMDDAFHTMRDYARAHELRLSELARLLVSRELPTQQVLAAVHVPEQ
ncbi:MAG TPA: GAF and ANTAR domain-containing protein [Mycobacteriales bacterium]|nr:GAF and ANTAR domain-containing protein [Mycobacteriales bacterium]